MVNNCTKNDIEKIKELGKLINSNFDKVNNIEELIKDNKIIGFYDNDILVGFLIYEQVYEIIDLLYIVVAKSVLVITKHTTLPLLVV